MRRVPLALCIRARRASDHPLPAVLQVQAGRGAGGAAPLLTQEEVSNVRAALAGLQGGSSNAGTVAPGTVAASAMAAGTAAADSATAGVTTAGALAASPLPAPALTKTITFTGGKRRATRTSPPQPVTSWQRALCSPRRVVATFLILIRTT